eukprot:CAMPEP_0202901364 /NCGR_PEP_ID=MMETSP1392-20130828/14212_1 /ASSEMBLY_ACC=CAM_ASM_000868 /TAXON_ID=225041 /ORGANISM="Chlamydomonas chlamydogama, Strain SAG 11-48b" /LENGTH=183 /DNA_ID=CAMNT_0049587913 /DNA_START=191 /DNA_END=742 /DNA_ORIENTATION=-
MLSAASVMLLLVPEKVMANPFQDVARGFIRPDNLSAQDAVVILLDAQSTLKEIADIAATPEDSQTRFVSRKLWPAFAKRLREAGPAAPVVAALITGGQDKEVTLSEEYGGKAGEQPGVTDRVYIGLGKVLTISGRTIRPEAQASPQVADEARRAIEDFLAQVPKDVYGAAQEFRVKRAAAAAS